MTRKRCLALLCLFLVGISAHAQETFPKPPELQPDVDFWVSIFTRYGTGEGVLHDNRNLAVVYERINVPPGLSSRQRQRHISGRRNAIRDILRTLASGKRDNLTAEEARILALWPENVSNETLQAAASRIRFQLGLSDRFRRGIERSGRWRAHIEAEFTALGVPLEIAALPHVESSYNPDARSHVGASGIWQFTRSTGRRFMRVDHVLDERNDPFRATTSAGQLLAYNYSLTGNWPMAITAYNHGLAGVRRAMRLHGDTNYVDILRNYKGRTFGFASRNFYVAFLAAMEVDQNPDKYFPGVTREQPTDYATVRLDNYIPADELSKALGISQSQLARHNPSLQATILTGNKHLPSGFSVRVPVSLLDSDIDTLVARVPGDSWASKQLPDLYHTVARGDTLSQIAEEYDTRVSTLVSLNALGSRHRIRIGQRIRLPAAGPLPTAPAETAPVATAAAVEAPATPAVVEAPAALEELTPGPMAGDFLAPVTPVTQTALLSDPSDYTVADDNSIEVQPLETLGHFADWLGIRTQRLRDINGLAFRTPVEVGQRIKLTFADIDADQFESMRVDYHRRQQDSYFRQHVITGVTQHVVRRGESVWILSLRQYGVPLWLFRQYNPGLDLHRVQPGTTLSFPVLEDSDRS